MLDGLSNAEQDRWIAYFEQKEARTLACMVEALSIVATKRSTKDEK